MNMRKIIIFVILCFLQTLTIKATILSGKCGENASFTISDDGTFVVNGYGDMNDYTGAGNSPWYSVRTKITSVMINEGITSIGSYSFISCSNLTTVKIPNSVTRIGNTSFYKCEALEDIELPNSLLSIGHGAFQYCSKFTNVVIPDNVVSIDSYAFTDCKGVETLVIGNSVSEFGSNVFERCYGLTSVTIGQSVEDLGTAFTNSSTKVNELIYAEGCTKAIKTNFSNISIVKFPNSLLEICDNAFYRFNKITNVELPNNLTRIGDYAFFDCAGLTSINIPSQLSYLGIAAFHNCKNLASDIIIPEKVKNIYERTFGLCSSISKVTLKNGVEFIGKQAFYWCGNIQQISFPPSLKTIDEEAFNDCEALNEIIFNEGLEVIGKSAFYSCNNISRLSTPSTLISIGDDAFGNCTNICELNFSNGLQSIGAHAFCGCNGLTYLRLPDSVTSVGESAFAGSSSGTGNHNFSDVEIGNGLSELTKIFSGTNHNTPKVGRLIIGNNINTISESTPIFGSDYFGNPIHSTSFLLTNNVVKFNCSTYFGPDCEFYVADASKYTADDIKKYGIKNITSTSSYNGEYSGTIPNINFTSYLDGYEATISNDYYNVGTYTSIDVKFSKDDFSSTITVPCNYTITKAPLTIAPYDVTITYGEELPAFNCFYQGLKNEETPNTALSKLPSVTTNAQKGNDAGEYKLYASGAESKNYKLSYQTGTLTIKPAQQTVVWNQSFDNILSDSKLELQATSSCGLKIKYNSSDPTIAYVAEENDKTYLYTRKDGVIVLTASQSGDKNHSAAVSVEKTIVITPRMATGINLNCSDIDLKVGDEYTLIVTVSPESTIDKSVEWSSSDNTVVSVSNGTIRALQLGEAIIKAKTKDGSNLTATCQVKVTPTLVESVSLSKSTVHLVLGNSEKIIATVLPDNATNKTIKWEVENLNIASVKDGLITAIGIGNTTVKAISNDGSGIYATCSVIVNPIAISSIELLPKSASVNVGETITLSATIIPSNASNQQLTWLSSDNDIATVTNGVVIGKKPGNVIITAHSTDGTNISATASIKVNDIKASNIYLDKSSINMFVGDEDILVATITPKEVTNKDVIWSTTNSNVVTVNNGVVVAKGYGNATISATTSDGTDLSATCQITVTKRSQSITWVQSFNNVLYGGQLIELTAKSSSGLKIKYKSKDENVASIFDLGDIVYLNPGNCGKTSIIAYQEGNNEYYPAEDYSKEVEVVNSFSNSSKTLVAYYSQSPLIDGIVAELANQIVGISGSVKTIKIEPQNNRINDASLEQEVRDSVMNVINSNPTQIESYPAIKPVLVEINDFDVVIMVYPLWNNTMAAPMQTFKMTYEQSLKNKEIGYIEYDETNNSGTSSNSKILRICISDIETTSELIKEWLNNNSTGINVVCSKGNVDTVGIYDLQGRKLQKVPNDGIYIINGHKIVINNGKVNGKSVE